MASYDELTVRFKALAHPVRLQMLDILRVGEVCVCHLEAVLGKRQAYISQQLMVLRNAGIVEARKEGLQVFYRLTDDVTADLLETIFGPVGEGKPGRIEGCSCPRCTHALENVS